jgi:hypothetical protein
LSSNICPDDALDHDVLGLEAPRDLFVFDQRAARVAAVVGVAAEQAEPTVNGDERSALKERQVADGIKLVALTEQEDDVELRGRGAL